MKIIVYELCDTYILTGATPAMIVSVVVFSEKPKSGYMPHLPSTRRLQPQKSEFQTIV